jgi:hypothetical protein
MLDNARPSSEIVAYISCTLAEYRKEEPGGNWRVESRGLAGVWQPVSDKFLGRLARKPEEGK